MKNILLTGATGFIGKHLLKALQNIPALRDDKIIVLSSVKVDGYTTIIHNNYNFSRADFDLVGIDKIDIILHAGAFIPKDTLLGNSIIDAYSNISSVVNLISNLPNKPDKFIFLSTVDVYKASWPTIISEDTPTEPVSLYGWSKLYDEKMLEVWTKQNNIILQVLRLGHIYGSGEEKYKKLIPVTIRKVLNGERPTIYTKGQEERSFLHISDCINAILASIALDEYVGPINVVSGSSLSIKTIIEKIISELKKEIVPEILGQEIPVRNLIFDNTKMRKYLVCEKVDFETGIREEISSFKL